MHVKFFRQVENTVSQMCSKLSNSNVKIKFFMKLKCVFLLSAIYTQFPSDFLLNFKWKIKLTVVEIYKSWVNVRSSIATFFFTFAYKFRLHISDKLWTSTFIFFRIFLIISEIFIFEWQLIVRALENSILGNRLCY